MYLSIPDNMVFAQINNKDYFIDKRKLATMNAPAHADHANDEVEMRPDIDIQHLLKNALRKNVQRLQAIPTSEFYIYLRRPPFGETVYLQYIPERNGAACTQKDVKYVSGSQAYTYRPQSHTFYGKTWDQITPLRPDRAEEVAAKRDAQRDNRRHTGDSPLPT